MCDFSYDSVGCTEPAERVWSPPPGGRTHESQVRVGEGDACWQRVSADVLRWGVKTASGFSVIPSEDVLAGREFSLLLRLGPLLVREPVCVVQVVREPDRVGFSYGTLPGHPVRGEEAFVVSRLADGSVWLTLRSLTCPGRGRWRLVFPALLVAQRVFRRRYARALQVSHRPRRRRV